MNHKNDEKLEERFARLQEQIERAKSHGIRGDVLAQRVESDLMQLMNSAWLNLYEYSSDQEEKTK